MYLEFYGLKKQPFHITPDPDFLYLSPSHKEALAAIIYGIEQRKGFVTITGAVGVGKTTILRSYLRTAEEKHLKIIYIFNSKLTFEGVLRTIYQELNLPIEGDDVVEMVNKLYEVLIEEYKQGNAVVLVVDEAQNMPIDTLESLRMISNLETSQDKLIQIVLVGQPEFAEQLNLDRLRQLKQRLAIRSTIQPLSEDDSLEYIKFRLQKAGVPYASVFTTTALKKIVKKAKGIPRVLNVLCDNALITGFGYQKKPVTRKIVEEIVRDFDGPRHSSVRRWWVPAAAALVVLAGALWVLSSNPRGALGKMGSLVLWQQKTRESIAHDTRPVAPQVVRYDPAPLSAEGKEPGTSPPETAPAAATKTVTVGDNLTKLAREVYGTSSSAIMKLLRENNPQIENLDVIHPGNKIVFPSLPQQQKSPNRWTSRG